MNKRILLTLLLCITAATCFASGEQSIEVNEEAIKGYEEIDLDKLDSESRYLGSTDKWHLFAKTLTSFAGDRPFDTTFGFKITSDKATIKNGWKLTSDEQTKTAFPFECQRLMAINKKEKSIVLTGDEKLRKWCLR